jgi:hypothetical protein
MAKTDGIQVKRSARFVTPKGRVSYPHIFKPTAFQGEGEPKFSCSLYIEKNNAGNEAAKAIKRLQEQALTELYPTKRPTNLEVWGLTDGDETDDPSAAGCWIVKASNKSRPGVVDRSSTAIIDESEVYGGCYGRINLCAKAYGTGNKGGVTLELVAFQKVEDGEPFGGAAKAVAAAVNEFGAFDDDEF